MPISLILRKDVPSIGKTGDVVEVADGYARNYLVPKGLAMKATPGALEQAQTMRKSRDIRDAKERGEAEEIARQLVPTVITISASSGPGGKLFGSIGAGDISDAIKAQTGLEVDRKSLVVDDAIRTLGVHQVQAKVQADVEFPVTIEVVEDE